MNIGELLELAAVVTARAPRLVGVAAELPSETLERYWSASKCRNERWAQSLRRLANPDDEPPSQELDDCVAVLQEILCSEVLTRVWAAVLTAYDRRRRTADAEPVARNVLAGHLEARHRALTLLVRGRNVPSREAAELNRLRRQSERWNDMLIGHLLLTEDVAEFAFDAELAREFADDFRGQAAWREMGVAWTVVAASLRGGFRGVVGRISCNADLNAQIGAAILCTFGHDLLDSFALPSSLWAARVFQTTETAQSMIEKLFAAERGDAGVLSVDG
ncbi:MAG TPA: hypothetical protein VG826_05885 [Pirellulales bacterium]|nr:hypothetical protein [Pirellulales bacterium]